MPTKDGHSKTLLGAEAGVTAPARPVLMSRTFSTSESVSWAGTVLPLTACVAIWGIRDTAPVQVAWLTVAHGVIGTAAFAWTVLQLSWRWRSPRPPRAVSTRPKPRLVAIYALLVLQPLIAMASSMLHGSHATVFGIPLPSVLPVEQDAARQVDRLHGVNAVLLLSLIALHVGGILRARRYSSTSCPPVMGLNDGATSSMMSAGGPPGRS